MICSLIIPCNDICYNDIDIQYLPDCVFVECNLYITTTNKVDLFWSGCCAKHVALMGYSLLWKAIHTKLENHTR